MKNLLRLLAFLFVLLPSVSIGGALPQPATKAVPKQPTWSQLTPEQQKILAPLAKDWDQLTDSQRSRFIATAKRYPKMTPAEQERFQQHLPEWNQLSQPNPETQAPETTPAGEPAKAEQEPGQSPMALP
jgi:hypothetical protein